MEGGELDLGIKLFLKSAAFLSTLPFVWNKDTVSFKMWRQFKLNFEDGVRFVHVK